MTTMEEGFSDQGREPQPEYETRVRKDGEGRERTVGSLFGELIGETTALVRAEVALARGEMQDNLHSAQKGVASMAVGGAVLTAGLLALVACAILALNQTLPDWLSALIVGAVISAIGAIMLAAGKRKALGTGLKPERTLNSLTDMKHMAPKEVDQAVRKWQ